jgi:hypothetical protein
MSAYTLIQLLELALFSGLALFGILSRSASLALVGTGLLLGKAILNVLEREGGTVRRRSLIGYTVGLLFVLSGLLLARLVGAI